MNSHTNMITWNRIAAEVADLPLPDAEAEILIYDDFLDDVVLGHLDDRGLGLVWVENSTDSPLTSPRFWAEKPFPLGA